jgi:hypothetical protein
MEKISRELDSTKTIVRTLEEILVGFGEWMVVVDANGIITMSSDSSLMKSETCLWLCRRNFRAFFKKKR